jgi:hypothetical protein
MQPGYSVPQPAANDKTTLWGVLGIVFALCCPILGAVFGVLSLLEARKFGKPPTLAIVAFVITGLNIIISSILFASGSYPGMN